MATATGATGSLAGAEAAGTATGAAGAGCGAGAVAALVSATGAATGAGAAGVVGATGAGAGAATRAGITRPLLSSSILPNTFRPGVLGASATAGAAGSAAGAVAAGAACATGSGAATTGAGAIGAGAAAATDAGAGAGATGAAAAAGAGLGAAVGLATAACACAFSSLWRRACVWRCASCLSWAEAANSFSNKLTCSPVSLVVGLFSTAIPLRERASTARSMPMFRSLAACKSRFGVASAILISRERIRSGCKGKD